MTPGSLGFAPVASEQDHVSRAERQAPRQMNPTAGSGKSGLRDGTVVPASLGILLAGWWVAAGGTMFNG